MSEECQHSGAAIPLRDVSGEIISWQCAACHTELPTNWGEGVLE